MYLYVFYPTSPLGTGCGIKSIFKLSKADLNSEHLCKVKHQQPHPGFELESPTPFPMTIIILCQARLLYIYISFT